MQTQALINLHLNESDWLKLSLICTQEEQLCVKYLEVPWNKHDWVPAQQK